MPSFSFWVNCGFKNVCVAWISYLPWVDRLIELDFPVLMNSKKCQIWLLIFSCITEHILTRAIGSTVVFSLCRHLSFLYSVY